MKKRFNWLLGGLAATALGCGTTGGGGPNPLTGGGPNTTTSSGGTDSSSGSGGAGSSGAGSSGAGSSGAGSSGATPPGSTSGPGGGTGGSTATDGGGGSSGGGVVFIEDPDGGAGTVECDIWAQDCPAGQKCMPWANDGGNSWNATKCSAVDPNPDQVGDPCTVEGSGVSGIDSCDESMMCWDVDGDTGLGVCIAFCSGSETAPECSNPATNCLISNDGVLILCLPGCDPLLQDCAGDNLCVPNTGEGFICTLDASGDAGGQGDPCDCANCCDAGLYCTFGPQWVAGCIGTDGCCTPFCDTTAPNNCVGAGNGEGRQLGYEACTAPPGQGNVGICVIPK